MNTHRGKDRSDGGQTTGACPRCDSTRPSGLNSGRKKSTKINFLGPETARWGGGLPSEGVVAKKFVLSLESLSSLDFGERSLGCPGNFCRDIPDPCGCSKSLCKNSLCASFVPYKQELCGLEFTVVSCVWWRDMWVPIGHVDG